MIDVDTPSRTNCDIFCDSYEIYSNILINRGFNIGWILCFKMYVSIKNKSYQLLINTKSHAYSIGQKYNI